MKSWMIAIAAGVSLAATMTAVAADSASTGTSTATTTSAPGAKRVEEKIASQFTIFSGSQDNAHSLVTGLRQGGEITLVAPADGGQAGTSTTFTSPTRPMGYGNVRISLALAQEQLTRLGIAQPTPEQLQAALVGGTVTVGSGPTAKTTELQGVLNMRAQGMGWGQIANAMGTKLGHVMSGLKQANQPLAAGQPVSGVGASGSTGITTAAGAGSGSLSARGQGRGSQSGVGGAAGAGIVTAAGGPAATSVGLRAGGEVRGQGLVTGAGTRASATGLMNGKGHAKP